MIEKIINWWLTIILLALAVCLTFGLLVGSLVVTILLNNFLYLLLNLGYLIFTPLLILLWKDLFEIVKDGGVLEA